MIKLSGVFSRFCRALRGQTGVRRRQSRPASQFAVAVSPEALESRALLTSTVSLVSDINEVPGVFGAADFVSVGSTTFFTANTADTGVELWKTDGTTAGTVLVKDIAPGQPSSAPRYLTNVDGVLYFSASTPDLGFQLWKSDGTEAGTLSVARFDAGKAASAPRNLTSYEGRLLFTANNGFEGRELWSTNTLPSQVNRITDINSAGSSNPDLLTVVDNDLFFIANDGLTGTELWKLDGDTRIVGQVRDISTATSGSTPANLTAFHGKLYFTATGVNGRQLWMSDGTEAGTVAITGAATGLDNPNPLQLTVSGDQLFFTASTSALGRELWTTTGVPGNAQLVRDINPRIASSSPSSLVDVAGTLYFSADDGTGGRELWKTDGSSNGAVRVADINLAGSASPDLLTNVNGTLYFSAEPTSRNRQLWKTDTLSGATEAVQDFGSSDVSRLTALTAIDGALYFSVTNESGTAGFWTSRGSDTTTNRVRTSTQGSSPGIFAPGGINVSFNPVAVYAELDGILYFSASNGVTGEELWRSDGTPAGTQLVRDIKGGNDGSILRNLTAVGNKLFFSALGGLWVSNGTSAGTSRIELPPGSEVTDPQDLVNLAGKLFFTAVGQSNQGRELWQSDGTAEGTFMVKDIALGSRSSNTRLLTVVGTDLYFSADNGIDGPLLWRRDGATGLTAPVSNRAFSPRLLTAGGDKLYFVSQGKLFVTDGTDVGTQQLTVDDVSETPMIYVDNILYFHGSNELGRELWKSDGIPSGTKLVKDINSFSNLGDGNSHIDELTVVGHDFYFSAFTPDRGFELWKSDGSEDGTTRVVDIRPGDESSHPQQLRAVNGKLYFVANDGIHGYELWESDPTSGETRLVKDLLPGAGSLDSRIADWEMPRLLTGIGHRLFFSATDGVLGQELYTAGPRSTVHPPQVTGPVGSTTDLTPTITWSPVAGATSYELSIQNSSTGTTPLEVTAASNTYTPATGLGIGDFVVRVRARLNGSDVTDWSEPFAFSLTAGVTLSSSTVIENNPTGETIGLLSTTDHASNYTFALVAGTGSADNGTFSVLGNSLRINAVANFEDQNSYSIRIRATQASGLTFEQIFSIAVANVNEPPAISSIPSQVISENRQTGILPISISDPEAPAGGLTLSAVSSNQNLIPNANIELSGSGANRGIQIRPVSDQFGTALITVTVSDGTRTSSQTFQVTVQETKPEGDDLIPLNASIYEHNAWMLGSVTVTVVAFESDGSVDPNLSNWSPAALANARQSIVNGLQWWVDTLGTFNSIHDLNFVYDFTYLDAPFQTGYDPRWRSHLGYAAMQNSFLEHAGVDLQAAGRTDLAIAVFNDRQRRNFGTNWGLTLFLLDESFQNEGGFDGTTNSGASAEVEGGYASFLGYGDGVANFAPVVAHEVGHIFHATDEYAEFPGAYDIRAGVYNTQNLNAVGGNPHPENIVPSIMYELQDAFDSHRISPSAAAMIGWQDTDGDGIFDVLDQPIVLNGIGAVDTATRTYHFSGRSRVTVFNSQDPERLYSNDLTINTIDLIEYRLNGGPWTTAHSYKHFETDVSLDLSALPAGHYTLEIRTRDLDSPPDLSNGISSNIFRDAFSISSDRINLDPGAPPEKWIKKQPPIAVFPELQVTGDTLLAGGSLTISGTVVGKRQMVLDQIDFPAHTLGTTSGPIIANGQFVLQIQFNQNASTSRVESFLRNIKFSTRGAGVKIARRLMNVTLTDATGESRSISRTIVIARR